MRIYLALTPEALSAQTLYPLAAYAVNAELCAAFDLPAPDQLRGESLEIAEEWALEQAALLSLLAQADQRQPRRVVAAAEIACAPAGQPAAAPAPDPALAALAGALPGLVEPQPVVEWEQVVSFHVDEAGAQADLQSLLQALTSEAEGEGEEAQTGSLISPALLWFDACERHLAAACVAEPATD